MSPKATARCSNAARRRDDDPGGSAPVARRWLLIEHPGPWTSQALDTPPLPGRIATALRAACDDNAAQILLIRRHGRQDEDATRHWYAVDTVSGGCLTGEWDAADDLLKAANSIGSSLSEGGAPALPMYLVCSHAARDACCAVRGRPIAAALTKAWPEEVWECTHLGGHRFAGNLLVLPEGACYGKLDLPFADKVIQGHLDGRVIARYLRGVTRFQPCVQAAVAWALREHGPAPIGAVTPGAMQRLSADVVQLELIGEAPIPEHMWVEVRTQHLEPAALSCGGPPKDRVAFQVAPVRVV